MSISSSKVLPLVVLAVVPLLATILSIVLSDFVPFRLSNPGSGVVSYAFSYIYVFTLITFVYAFYPIKFSIIQRRGFGKILIEYEYVKKILYFEIPILIVSTFFISTPSLHSEFSDQLYHFTADFPVLVTKWVGLETYGIIIKEDLGKDPVYTQKAAFTTFVLNGLMINLGLSVTAGIIYMILITVKKDLKFYFAKTVLEIASKEKEETKKANSLFKAIKIYDGYLRRALDLQISNTKEIYSKLLIDSSIDRNKAIESLSTAFERDNDKLKPVKCLSEIANVQETKKFLVEQSIRDRIKDLAIFFATIIPVAITIIQLLLPK